MRALPDTHPFVQVRDYFATAETAEASDRLSELRNDTAHGRAFRPGEKAHAIKSALEDLALLYRNASPAAEYALVHVVESRWDTYAQRNELEFRRLMGFSTHVPVETMTVESNEIENGSLYLLDNGAAPQLVSPLLVAEDCPGCGHFATFHPDRVLPDGQVEYRSLEHGHSLKPSDAARRLVAVGFLSATG